MKTNISKLAKQQNHSFSSMLLAFSLIGFLHPNAANLDHARYHVSLVKPNEVQQNDKSSWYTPPRSPAFSDLFGS
jgi:hypothetical protein